MNKVVYYSRSGHTQKIALAIARGAGVQAEPVEQCGAVSATDTLFVGASIYGGVMDGRLRAFLQSLEPSEVKRVTVFGTSAGPKSALDEVKSILRPKGIAVVEEAFHCKGSFLFLNLGRPNGEDAKKAEAFAGRICGARHG